MKNLLIAAAFAVAVTTSIAQITERQQTIVCGPTKTISEELQSSEYSEKPVWFGQSPDKKSGYVLLVNSATQTWTLLQYNQEVACIIGFGIQSRQINSKQQNVKAPV